MATYKHWKNVSQGGDFCFVTTTLEEFLPLLADHGNAMMFLSALDFYRAKYGILILGYVVMPEHVHLMIGLPENLALSKLMADLKRYTSKRMLEWCRAEGRADLLSVFSRRGAVDSEAHSVWQRSFRSVPIEDEADCLVKLRYIHDNPVKRQLVSRPEDWPYSSAGVYAGGVSPIRVDTAW